MSILTTNYRFVIPDFDSTGWDTDMKATLIAIDALLGQFTTGIVLQGLWTNSTVYSAGVSVIDGLTGNIWACGVNHTSAAFPTTFNTDRTNFPSYWTNITNPAITAQQSAINAANSATAAAASAVTAATGLFSFRNRLVNGAMELHQRAASPYAVLSGNVVYTTDRWFVLPNAVTATGTVVADTAYGSRNALQASGVVPVGGTIKVGQRLEAANTFDLVGKTVTVSFWLAYTVTAGTTAFTACLRYPTAGVDNYSSQSGDTVIAFTPSATPGLYSATFTPISASAINGMQFTIVATQAGLSGTLSFTVGTLTLEVGTVANSFERRPYALEKMLCMRYYQKLTGVQFFGNAAAGGNITTTTLDFSEMRAAPTITQSGTSFTNATSITTTAITPSTAQTYVAATAAGVFVGTATFALVSEL